LDLFIKSNIQDFQPLSQADLAIAGDAQATLPSLIEEVKRQITADRKRVFEERGKRIAEGTRKRVNRQSKKRDMAGIPAPSVSPGSPRNSGRSSRMKIGRSSDGKVLSVDGLADCGTWISTTITSAVKVAAVSATTLRLPWAPPWRI